MPLRVLHHLVLPDSDAQHAEQIVALSQAVREMSGCLESEVYRALDGPQGAIVELWESEAAYAAYWVKGIRDESQAKGFLDNLRSAPPNNMGSEFYRHEYFSRTAGSWRPRARDWHGSQAISWPAGGGGVRVVVQGTTSEDGPIGPAEGIEETRREPGCLQFQAYQSLEYPLDSLLLELWASQALYDAHWRLRIRTREAATAGSLTPSPPVDPSMERGQGSNGMEFYRHVQFHHLYDRWLPTDPDAWADTVEWSPW